MARSCNDSDRERHDDLRSGATTWDDDRPDSRRIVTTDRDPLSARRHIHAGRGDRRRVTAVRATSRWALYYAGSPAAAIPAVAEKGNYAKWQLNLLWEKSFRRNTAPCRTEVPAILGAPSAHEQAVSINQQKISAFNLDKSRLTLSTCSFMLRRSSRTGDYQREGVVRDQGISAA